MTDGVPADTTIDRRGVRTRGLLTAMATAGLVGFGGGSALIPIFDKEVVAKRGLLDEPTFTQHTVVANLTPGALPVKLAAVGGHTISGATLAALAAFTVSAPGALGTLALLAGANTIGPGAVQLIRHASVGISVFIIVLLIGYIWKVHSRAGRRLPLFVAITVLTALLSGSGTILGLFAGMVGLEAAWEIPRLSAVEVIVLSLVVIIGYTFVIRRRRPHTRHDRPRSAIVTRRLAMSTATFAMLSLAGVLLFGLIGGTAGWRIGGLLAFSTMTSFGGGEAYIGVADGFFVHSGLVDSDMFFTQLVPIANALPGPILVKVTAGIGYVFGAEITTLAAWTLGLAAILISVGTSCAIAIPVLGAYDTLGDHPLMSNIATYILPVICGLLIQVSASMLEVSASVGAETGIAGPALIWTSLAIIAVLSVAHIRKWVPDMLVLAACAVASLVVLGL